MPHGADAISEAVLTAWLIDEASPFEAAQTIATVETADALVSVQAHRPGVVLKVLVSIGDHVAAGMPLAVLGDPDDPAKDMDAFLEDLDHDSPACEVRVRAVGSKLPTPLVRRVPSAPSPIRHAGPSASHVRRVYDALAAATDLSPGEVVGMEDAPVPLVPVIAPETGDGAASPAPPHPETSATGESVVDFYLRATIAATPLLTVVDEINEGSTAPVSLRHLMIKAVAGAHRRVPELRTSWAHERGGAGSATDVAVDLETEDGPVRGVLPDVTSVTISTLAERICELATVAGERDTVASTGLVVVTDRLDSAAESDHVSRHAAVLAIGALGDRGGSDRDTVVTVALSLARCRSGPVAARWMAALLDELEHPVRLLA